MNVLVVEDDPGIGRFIHRGLGLHGYGCTVERDGRRTAELLHSGRFAALILDRGLPDGDGLDLCRRLRAAGIEVPVILLTARGALQDRLDGFAVGADDYLAKPFAFDELLARLAAVVRRSRHRSPAPVVAGSLVLQPQARTAEIAGRPVPLSPRAFDLLLELARAAGAIVARETLLNAVWGSAAAVSDNALDVYVGYLRRHLAAHATAPSIETLRRQGFRLLA